MSPRRGYAWVYDPQRGGTKIPTREYAKIRERIEAHARKLYPKHTARLDIFFRGQFCYVDAYAQGEDFPTHLCRLRHFREDNWSLAFFTYSDEKYSPCFLNTNAWCGTIEEAFEPALSGGSSSVAARKGGLATVDGLSSWAIDIARGHVREQRLGVFLLRPQVGPISTKLVPKQRRCRARSLSRAPPSEPEKGSQCLRFGGAPTPGQSLHGIAVTPPA